MAKENVEKLVCKLGAAKGKEYTLSKPQYVIGGDRKCSIVVKGNYVSPIHAVLDKRDDGVWVISNRSPNRTLVNRIPVDAKPLAPGDSIQIGAETLFSYEIIEPKKKQGKGKDKSGKSGGTGILKKPGVVIGLGVYFALMIGGMIFFAGGADKKDSNILSSSRVNQVLEQTRTYLKQGELTVDGQGISGLNAHKVDSTEPAALYYRLLARRAELGEAARDDPELATMADEITARAHKHLTRAWHLESQGSWRSATAEYAKVIGVIPDIGAPIARLAATKERETKAKIKQRKKKRKK